MYKAVVAAWELNGDTLLISSGKQRNGGDIQLAITRELFLRVVTTCILIHSTNGLRVRLIKNLLKLLILHENRLCQTDTQPAHKIIKP